MMEKLSERRRGGSGGFTLIELLVVIVILGILAAVVVFAVGGITDKGEESSCKADAKTLRVAMEAAYAQNGAYPADEDALVAAGFLSEPSELHDIDVPGVAADYDIVGVGRCA